MKTLLRARLLDSRLLCACLLHACLLPCLLPGASGSVRAAQLELELPQPEWLLPAVGPPLLQREGNVLPSEQERVEELSQLIAGDLPAALAFVRAQYTDLAERLEAGDPEGWVRARVVRGGFEPTGDRGRYSAALLYLVGHVYMAQELHIPAGTAFLSALVVLPDYARVHESLGLLYLDTEYYDLAQTHLSRALALGLNTPAIFGALGYLNHQKGNYWGAVSGYQQATMLDPDSRQWRLGLLYALHSTYQYDSALTLVDGMLRETPEDLELWLYRSQAALRSDEREVALSSLETALRLGDASVANLQVCAALHLELGSVARAVDLLGTALANGLEFQYADQALARLALLEEWEPLRELLAAAQDNATALDDLQRSTLLTHAARLAQHDGATADAITRLEEALQLDPANAGALIALGDIRRAARDYNRAELLYQRASADAVLRENALLSLAQLAIDQENFARALDLLRQVLAANPARSDLRGNIASLENLVLLRE